MVFVTSDPHGHVEVLLEALRDVHLVDRHANWAGGDATLWCLGDLMDRGPDGIGVVDLLMRLQRQAEEAGGTVGTVLGNHDVLALGVHRFGARNGTDEQVLSLVVTWQRNGGRDEDQAALTDDHIEWLTALPALAEEEGHLLMHSDTTEYLTYGSDIQTVNRAFIDVLRSDDLDRWWDCMHVMFDRYAFAQRTGFGEARRMMDVLGVRRLVHGHSIIADLRGVEPAEVSAPLLYAHGQVLAIDGGIYAGGPCLVVDLDTWPDS